MELIRLVLACASTIFLGGLYLYQTKPRQFETPEGFIFSDVSLIPDGIYEVLFEFKPRMVFIASTFVPRGKYQKVYVVPISQIPRSGDGKLVKHIIKAGKEIC